MRLLVDIDDCEYEKIKVDAEKFRSKGMVVPYLYKIIESGIPLSKEFAKIATEISCYIHEKKTPTK